MTQKILVVEDELASIKLVRAYLEKAGYAVVTATAGQEALSVFRHERPNLVILDLNLPGMDGLDVCRALRRPSDVPRRQASKVGRPLDLTTMEFDLLAVLVAHPGQVFTRMLLLEQVQETAYAGYERTIDAHIKNLRAKLEDDPHNPRFIETVRGVG